MYQYEHKPNDNKNSFMFKLQIVWRNILYNGQMQLFLVQCNITTLFTIITMWYFILIFPQRASNNVNGIIISIWIWLRKMKLSRSRSKFGSNYPLLSFFLFSFDTDWPLDTCVIKILSPSLSDIFISILPKITNIWKLSNHSLWHTNSNWQISHSWQFKTMQSDTNTISLDL